MLTALFDRITKLSIKFRWLVLALSVITMILGVLALQDLNLELLPKIEFPQTVVVIQWPDSESVDQFLQEVTVPLEDRLSDVKGVVNVESTTSKAFAYLVVRNEFGLDQDEIVADIEEVIAGTSLPEGIEKPQVLNFSLSDLPVVVASASSGALTLPELKELVTADLQPRLEELADVSRVNLSGGQELPEETDAGMVAEAGAEPAPEETAGESGEPEASAPGASAGSEATAEATAEPGQLPAMLVQAAQAQGIEISNIKEITPDMLAEFGAIGEQALTGEQVLTLLSLIPPDTWRYALPETLALMPKEYADALEPELLKELDSLASDYGGVGAYSADEVAEILANPAPAATPEVAESSAGETVTEAPHVAAVVLPESWQEAGARVGRQLETTADIPAEVMGAIVDAAPALLNDLDPAMWRALDPEAVDVALSSAEESLDPELMLQLEAIQLAAAGQTAEPIELPKSWVEAAKSGGLTVKTTADLTPETIELLTADSPQLFGDLVAAQILSLSPDVQAALPETVVDSFEPAVRDTLMIVMARRAESELGSGESETAPDATPPPAPTADPARLPDVLIQGAQGFGVQLEYAYDITPEFMRQIAAIGPQGLQVLALLTPDNLRALQPEVIALLPAEFVDGLDPALRAELDDAAAEYGGAGQLAVAEAEAEPVAPAGAPSLTGIWIEPAPTGEPSQFQTAADILNNGYVPGAAQFLNFFIDSPQIQDPAAWMQALTPDVLQYLAENEDGFAANLSPAVLELMAPEALTFFLDNYPEAFDDALTQRLQALATGEATAFAPEATITRTDGDPSLILSVYKDGDANTVVVAHSVFDALAAYEEENPEVTFNLAFEQASFIEDAVTGVAREGLLGAVFAVLVILIFLSGRVGGRYKLSWRATAVVGISIPLSILIALALMRWVPPTIGTWIHDLADSSGSGFLAFIAQLFPSSVTLNIMTLSGLTVAVGRVVDDSIVVLENSYRYIQKTPDRFQAVTMATREVAIAIFASTATTVAVFLPLGLLGGLVGSFFLPFGLTVTYSLAASFVVAITVVPALVFLLIFREHIPEERETWMQRTYTPPLRWALSHRGLTMAVATLIFLGSLFLLQQLPRSFIPSLGEPTVNVSVELPGGTPMQETDGQAAEFEAAIADLPALETMQTEVGSAGGIEAFFGGGGVSQNQASITISVADQEHLMSLTEQVRQRAKEVFGEENVVVSAASQTGFSGFSLVVTGNSMEELVPVVGDIKEAIAGIDFDEDGHPDIVNITSSVDNAGTDGNGAIIRIDGQPAISFDGEMETENTLEVTGAAKEAVSQLDGLPQGAEVTEGFESEQQVQGFQDVVRAIIYSIVIVYIIMALSFRSPIHPFTILFTLPFALVGASVALFITDSVLGISAMIGLMMLVGIVVTNAIVLLELVQQLRKRGQNAPEALVEGGRTRLRPIWMTALAASLALLPLALSQEAGAIIAAELATVVIGGLLFATVLTLVVVPVVYSLFDDAGRRIRRRVSS